MLSGPLLVHKPLARMAVLASAIRAGTAPDFEPLRDVDSAIRAVAERSAAAKAEAMAAVAAHPGLAQLTEVHAGLVRTSRRWTGPTTRPTGRTRAPASRSGRSRPDCRRSASRMRPRSS